MTKGFQHTTAGFSMNNKRNVLHSTACAVYRNLTLMLFLLLPVKVTRVFLDLSVAVLITEMRGLGSVDNCFDIDKFNRLLNMNYNKEILKVPSHTLSWFWTPEVLGKELSLQEGTFTLRQALTDDKLLRHNLGTITSFILRQLPYLMKVKLRTSDERTKLQVRHEVMSFLNQGLVPA